jgi:hypothetical protein
LIGKRFGVAGGDQKGISVVMSALPAVTRPLDICGSGCNREGEV